MTTRTVTVPPVFYHDHRARGCGETGVIVKETTKGVTVRLDEKAFADLLSDADYYGGPFGWFDAEYNGLVLSARATLRKLRPLIDQTGEAQ